MTIVFTLLTLAVLGLVAAVAVGRIGGGLDAPASSLPSRGLPPGPVAGDDLDDVRFSPALRGYRMDEVDVVLDRVGDELRRRDAELDRLRAALGRFDPLAAQDPDLLARYSADQPAPTSTPEVLYRDVLEPRGNGTPLRYGVDAGSLPAEER